MRDEEQKRKIRKVVVGGADLKGGRRRGGVASLCAARGNQQRRGTALCDPLALTDQRFFFFYRHQSRTIFCGASAENVRHRSIRSQSGERMLRFDRHRVRDRGLRAHRGVTARQRAAVLKRSRSTLKDPISTLSRRHELPVRDGGLAPYLAVNDVLTAAISTAQSQSVLAGRSHGLVQPTSMLTFHRSPL